ncbi:hypothetical protein ACIGD1_17975 [Streptomyces sp. NPDC085612]|uniref:hypothetical protein n=1 Tax=Streptomyces sp. NPDC085612 TaxID=3365732 RepID=UPI0037CE9413
MHIDGPEQQRGHVLLIAGDAAVRRRTVRLAPGANLAALAMVPAALLLGSDLPSDTVYLDGARDPNTVLARLRTAAGTRGPLLLYLSGRLTADRRGRRLHLALAGTTPGTVRYTALAWEWLTGELRDRPAGTTTLLVDLAADKEAWPLLGEYGTLPAPPGAAVYGVVAPPEGPAPAAGHGAVSGYTRHWIDQLRRAPARPADVQLHALAAGAAGPAPGTLVVPTARDLETRPAAVPAAARATAPAAAGPADATSSAGAPDTGPADPRARLHALATGGRHTEAAALARTWEQQVLDTRGPGSPEAVRCTEIRADLARMAGDFDLATALWTGAVRTRLAGQGAAAPEVHDAAAGALYCWTRLKDPVRAVPSGADLLELLRALPRFDPRHLRLTEQRLEALRAAVRDGAALHG